MSMEYRHTIVDAHPKSVLCVQFNPIRREIYTGSEDGVIRVWESETGKLINSLTEHAGWITALLFSKELKLLFSASIDGLLVVWGKIPQKIKTNSPIYSLAYNSRRQQVLAGCNKKVRVFQVNSNDDAVHGGQLNNEILERKSVCNKEHTDIVSCIVSCEGRFYSAGYDRKIIIYDSTHHGTLKVTVANVIYNAHDAAISCMVYGKDADNSWLITGSFDRTVKLWSLDGNLLQKFDGFSDTITSLCYVVPTQTLWITANSPIPIVYDPRSGVNVSDFVKTDTGEFHQTNGPFSFKQLLFVAEVNEVVGITNRRSVTIWKYNPFASCTVLSGHVDVVECLTFTAKEPLLIFSGGGDGTIRKWERLQLNTFMYSQEPLTLPKEEKREEEIITNSYSKNSEERRRLQAALHRRVNAKLDMWKRTANEDEFALASTLSSDGQHEKQLELMSGAAVAAYKRKEMQMKGGSRQQMIAPERKKLSILASKPGVISLIYYEELDFLISGYEDSKIYVWGYNEEAVKFVPNEENVEMDVNLEGGGMGNDSVTNRVAGMTLKYVLQDHKEAVTALACFNNGGSHWLLTTGWDRRLCIWDIKHGVLHDVFRNNFGISGKEELAADGIILSIEYCDERGEFAYASADKLVYIRRFTPKGDEMQLLAVLQGHEAEVTQIKWNKYQKQWVTGSEDRTIRIWPAEGIPCLKVINNDGPVTALCIDNLNGCIVTGSQDRCIRVFDQEKKDEVVQKNLGHNEEIRAIIHIAARNQFRSSMERKVAVDPKRNEKYQDIKRSKLGQRRTTTKTSQIAHNGSIFSDTDEMLPTFSELNPLIMPKLLSKQIYTKENANSESQDHSHGAAEQYKLEDELKLTLNDLETALGIDKFGAKRKLKSK
ncbi:hypothetical protein HK098_001370 [Nowakowskiella sp. JEL0407]|nr:hypothetical protein HK098_001370 [Nowakowskiella sp. JEL0407]